LDDIVAVLLELRYAFLLGKAEDLLVHLGPKHNTAGSQLVDGLSHLGTYGNDSASGALVGLLPLAVFQSRRVDDGLLGLFAGVSLLGNHHAATKQTTIKRHGRVTVLP